MTDDTRYLGPEEFFPWFHSQSFGVQRRVVEHVASLRDDGWTLGDAANVAYAAEIERQKQEARDADDINARIYDDE